MKKQYAKVPTIFQMEARECGAASLAMILAYFGIYKPLEQVRMETGVSRDGSNAANLLRAAKQIGLQAKGYKKSLKGLLECTPPCIIHWNFNHFVVYEGKKGNSVYLNDPAVGRRKLTIQELDEGFTGIVLTFQAGENIKRQKNQRTFVRFVLQRLKGQYGQFMAIAAIGFFLVFPGLLLPLLSQFFIDDILLTRNQHWTQGFLVLVSGTIVFQALLYFYRGWLLDKLQNKLSMVSCHRLLNHLFRLPIQFFDQRYAGDLSERVGHNDKVANFLAGELAETALNLCIACFYLGLLIFYSPLLTLIGLMTVVLNLTVVKLSASSVANNTIKMQQDEGKLIGAIYAGLSITSTLKASGAENEYVNRIQGHYAKTIRLEQRLGKLQGILHSIPSITSQLASVLVLMMGSIQIMQGKMTVGMLVAFTGLLTSFTAPVEQLVIFVHKIQQMKSSMGQLQDILQYEQDDIYRQTEEKIAMSEKLSGQVEVANVSFGYSKLQPPLIENFSFRLACGSSIAFVGSSGCGKSTISKLVSGLYLPWEGEIRFDGIPFNHLPKEIVFSSISTVSQDIMLFSGTIRENLTLWNQSILEEDMIRAAKDACIHETITQKPGAYEYCLSEEGRNLSVGQRQRMEIARALVTNPTILILDEATSALDPVTEKKILDNIKRRGCTCIIVAHRLSAIRDCDEIIVMDSGKIVQRGTHEELMKQQGHYQRLVQTI